MTATTQDPLVSPVPTADLAAFLGDVTGQNALLDSLLLTATDTAIRYTGRDLLTRTWVAQWWEWPTVGTPISPSLARASYRFQQDITLPYATVADDVTVEVDGESVTEGFVVRTNTVFFRDPPALVGLSEQPALRIEYKAGYGPVNDDVPQAIRTAITMLAAFLFEHRGECDAMEAVKRSGAAGLLAGYRVGAVLA